MKFLASAKSLFIGMTSATSFHQALQVADATRQKMLAARKEIRQQIRASASHVRIQDEFWDSGFARRHSARSRPEIVPKFFTQGSFAYDLLVAQAQKPPQQLDLDDGMYVSVDYLDNGEPALVARALFRLVEEALKPLCVTRGWKLDTGKETCVRVELDRDTHVDIPIYSAPRQHAALMDASLQAEQMEVMKRTGKFYPRLPSHQIMLAHRNGSWEQSDPLKLQEWVENCVTRYGEGFRRACRYFKGWRDFRWERCCLSSITIMAAVAESLKQMAGTHRTLDDDRLVFEIAQRLPSVLGGTLYNPAFPDEDIVLNGWSEAEKAEIIAAARDLAATMRDGLCGTADADIVVTKLRKAFGTRIPYRPDAVVILPPISAAVVSEAPATVPAPKILPSTSG